MLSTPIETLKQYVNQPSGSRDVQDTAAMARIIAGDLSALGFAVTQIPGRECGPVIKAVIGRGTRQLMLMGHFDTVFPHAAAVPFTPKGDGTAMGSGICDMKGGVVILLYALKNVLTKLDLNKYRLVVLLNPDEEIGSEESGPHILQTAKESFAALSFEPSGLDGRLTCARKGVTSLTITCTGIPGHAGAMYKQCASAVQALCAHITALYALRDDEHDISFNAGAITGGTAENVVAGKADARCEFRYFDEALKPVLSQKILDICAREPVPGVKTEVVFGAAHPAIDLNEKSRKLLDIAMELAAAQGLDRRHERTGGAGDISIAGQAGIGVLDGLGMPGAMVHTTGEYAVISGMEEQIGFASNMILKVCP